MVSPKFLSSVAGVGEENVKNVEVSIMARKKKAKVFGDPMVELG